MSEDFILVPNTAKIPADPWEQIAWILHRSVYDELFRVLGSSDPLRSFDYSRYFTVTVDDLLTYLLLHPEEFNDLLPKESWDGLSVVREGTIYNFRWHHRGVPIESEQVVGFPLAATKWLRWCLDTQGLRKMYDRHRLA